MLIAYICQRCEVVFTRRRGHPPGVYCSRACMAAHYAERMAGSGNPAWRGGRWPYKGARWDEIARAVVTRDKRCADCGDTRRLIAHHLIPQRFWLRLEEANRADNLLAVCHTCHVKRPEHYWVELPADRFDPALHSRTPMPRTTTRLKRQAPCAVCGTPVKRCRSRFCSYHCSNVARWRNGVYGSGLVRNITAAVARVG